MKIQIKSVFGDVIFEGDFSSVSEAVSAAVKGRANLTYANLTSANLTSADLRSANLTSANLTDAQAHKLYTERTILPEGDLIGYKKLLGGVIAKLRIPADAKRVGGMTGRKCRAEFAIVLEGEGRSSHDSAFVYEVGKKVTPTHPFDPCLLDGYRSGIHFFITREEAEAY